MHRKTELEYKDKYRNKQLIQVLHELIELNHQYRRATVAFLLHPNPPYRDSDILYIQFIKKKIEILQEVIKEKQR